ncbi:E3 ubiquitin-protein ligase XIAP-like isoform X2 [Mytilus trossulus]
MYGFSKMNVGTLMLRLRERVSSGPLHPDFKTLEARKRNLNGIIDPYSSVAEAGFFADSSCGKERICCFYCDGNLRNQLLSYNPFREHSRWFPVCPFILQQKGEKYIHTVSQDTNILKTFLKNKMRTSCMDTNVVVEAMQVYPQYAIGKIVEEYFIDNGYFPCREDLFESLENLQLWKTSETYDYCRVENRR